MEVQEINKLLISNTEKLLLRALISKLKDAKLDVRRKGYHHLIDEEGSMWMADGIEHAIKILKEETSG